MDVSVTKPLIEEKPVFACGESFVKVALHYMNESDLMFPKTFPEAKNLYCNLLNFISNI